MMLLFSSSNVEPWLRLVSDNGVTLVLEHDPTPGAIGYRISPRVINGVRQTGNKQWAHTWDTTQLKHKFASGHPPYVVEALMPGQSGTYPNS